MNPKIERPHFIRRTAKDREKPEKSTSKLFLLILKRVFTSKLKGYLEHIRHIASKEISILVRTNRIFLKNIRFIKLQAWRKLVVYSKMKRFECQILKFVLIVSAKYQRNLLASSYRSIIAHANRILNKNSQNIWDIKIKITKNVLMKVSKKNLRYAFEKITKCKEKQKFEQNRIRLFVKILQRLVKQRKFYSWARIINLNIVDQQDLQHEIGEMSKQVDHLKKQLAQKNKQILQLHSSERYTNNQNHGFEIIKNGGRDGRRFNSLDHSRRSYKSIGKSNKDLSEKGSDANNNSFQNNTSILSWINGLNNSFFSIKSGRSNTSKVSTRPECYCKYRQKYNQYKIQVKSLKNQLEIIQNELDVTKDLNDHLQAQISTLCTKANQKSPELQLLKLQVKELKRQKQIFKDKLLKAQKYIEELKHGFKMKTQNIYRNLKRGNS